MFLTLNKGDVKQSASLLLCNSLQQCLFAVVTTEIMLIRQNKTSMFRAADMFSVLCYILNFLYECMLTFLPSWCLNCFCSSAAYWESSLLVLHAGVGFLSFFASPDLSGHQEEGEPGHSFFVMFKTHCCQSLAIESLQQAMISWTMMKDTLNWNS